MKNSDIKSILREVLVEEIVSLEERVRVIKRLNESDIKSMDRKIMISRIERMKSVKELNSYLWNCLMKYEGCGVVRI